MPEPGMHPNPRTHLAKNGLPFCWGGEPKSDNIVRPAVTDDLGRVDCRACHNRHKRFLLRQQGLGSLSYVRPSKTGRKYGAQRHK